MRNILYISIHLSTTSKKKNLYLSWYLFKNSLFTRKKANSLYTGWKVVSTACLLDFERQMGEGEQGFRVEIVVGEQRIPTKSSGDFYSR